MIHGNFEGAAQKKTYALVGAAAAIAALEKAGHGGDADAPDADMRAAAADYVIGIYQHRLGGLAQGTDPEWVRGADQAERAMRLAALQAERGTILRLARLTHISDETARKLMREIDLVEARYR